MTIKLSPLGKMYLSLSWICTVAFILIICISYPYKFNVVIVIIFLLLVTKASFITGRTIIMNSSGCTVKFLFFKKFYQWEKLGTKVILDYSTRFRIGRGNIYKKGCIFSPKKNLRISKRFEPLECAIFYINPAKFFVVNFRTPQKVGKFNDAEFYEVDEAEFLAKMEEWGVELTYES